jgi:hypothetical protein
MDLPAAVQAALEPHPAVDSVTLAGSRARGTETPLSDWDFQVETNDFEALGRALPQLVDPLDPLSRQWDRYSPHPTYMLMLRGPLKLDLLFLGRVNDPRGPWIATPDTLPGIDDHFWDWVLWLKSKQHRVELSRSQRLLMHTQLLGPVGAPRPPTGVEDAVTLYLEARTRAERVFGVRVDRTLGDEVLKALQ